MPIPRNQIPIGEGIGPDGEEMTFFVDKDVVDAIERDGPQWKSEDARFVDEAIRAPDAILEGLKRPGLEESGLCYSIRPTIDPDEPENPTLPRFGVVLLAFVRRCQGGLLVYDWEWREEDSDFPGRPIGWEKFGRLLWPKA